MSRVFVGTERALNRTVVVKVLTPDLAADVNRERFRREIMLAAQLQHPHIVPVLSAGEDGDLLWYTMPFVEGESLREEIRAGRRLAVREVTRVLHDVLDALDYAHARKVIHRDIKPGNILKHRSHSLVTDFGVAKALSASMPHSGTTSAGMAIGTPAYMAPEQLAADPRADHRVDLYAVGLLAYELLTGTQPFAASSPQETLAAQLTRMPTPLTEVRPDLPPPLSGLITRLLAKSPDERPATAAAALEELDALATPGESTASRSWVATPASPMRRRTIVAVAAFLVVVALGWSVLLRGRGSPGAAVAPPRATADSAPRVASESLKTIVVQPLPSGGPSKAPAATKTGASASAVGSPGAASSGSSGSSGSSASKTVVSGPGPVPRPLPVAATKVAQSQTKGTAGTATKVVPQRSNASATSAPVRRFTPARRVAVLPPRYAPQRTDLAPVARALNDSLRKAFAAMGYEIASDADLVLLLSQPGGQRRAAQAADIGAVVTSEIAVRGGEVRAQANVNDIWRNGYIAASESADVDKAMELLGVVRDATRALDRVSWRRREDPRMVVVYDFDNNSGIDSIGAIASRITANVRAAVAPALQATLVGDSAARATRDMTERRELATRLRAGVLISGSVQRTRGDSLVVRLGARDLSEETSFPTVEARVPTATAVEALEPIIARFVEMLGRVNWGPKGDSGN